MKYLLEFNSWNGITCKFTGINTIYILNGTKMNYF